MKRFLAFLLTFCIAVAVIGCGEESQPAQTQPVTTQPQIQVPADAIAAVVTGEQTVYVKSVKELEEAVDATGNSTVTLLQDISHNKTVTLPYACTMDFGGHTLTTNPEMGIGLKVVDAGSENAVTTLKNGVLRAYSDGIRSEAGGISVENMQIYCVLGTCVNYYVPAGDAQTNRITGSTLVSEEYACVAFGKNDADYSKSGLTIADTVLIAAKQDGQQVFVRSTGETACARVVLGDGVGIYTYSAQVAGTDMLFTGSGLCREETDVSADGKTYTAIQKWSKDTENKVLDVLMIGNSFCLSYTEELHGMAKSEGIQMNIQNLYYGGRSIKAHWERLESGQADYDQFWITNDFGRFQDPANKTIQSALDNDQWDVITLQQHFDVERTVDYETALASCTPYAKNLYDHLKTNYPDADLYWHETWAYGVGYPTTDNGRMPVDSVAVQTRQYNQIRDVSKALCEESGVKMIPDGDAWQIARANAAIGDTLNKADRCHDGDAGGGQYLNACVWFEVLTGKSCIGNTWRPDDYILAEEKIPHLQQAAHEAVAAIYGADYAK